MKGLLTVFNFTFRRQMQTKSYIAITVIFAILLLAVPAVILPLIAENSAGSGAGSDPVSEFENFSMDNIEKVFIASEADELSGLSVLENSGITGYENAEVSIVESREAAVEAASSGARSLAAVISEENDGYMVRVILPDLTELTKTDADTFAWMLSQNIKYAAVSEVSFTAEQLAAVLSPVGTSVSMSSADSDGSTDVSGDETASEETDEYSGIRKGLMYILTYINIMLVYFLVLFYGQGAANLIIMEKTSKLMDTFLVSVRPRDLIFGKMLAVFLSAVIQFLTWVVSAAAGFFIGTRLALMVDPETDMAIIRFFRSAENASSLFTPGGIVIAVLMVLAGLLLYCALASIGGSMAEKPEDLSSALTVFTLVLILSFFATLYSGFLSDSISTGLTWLDIVPFTSILVTPSRLLLGSLTVWEGLLSFGIVIAFTVILVLLAARVYKAMSMYKGNPPKIGELVRILRN